MDDSSFEKGALETKLKAAEEELARLKDMLADNGAAWYLFAAPVAAAQASVKKLKQQLEKEKAAEVKPTAATLPPAANQTSLAPSVVNSKEDAPSSAPNSKLAALEKELAQAEKRFAEIKVEAARVELAKVIKSLKEQIEKTKQNSTNLATGRATPETSTKPTPKPVPENTPSATPEADAVENPYKDINIIWDKTTISAINKLHPLIQNAAIDFILDAQSKGINLRITSGYRSVEEQNKLYNQGRTEPGSIVTNAKGGQSYHNFGLAFDVVEIKDGKALWDNDWATIGEIGKANGLEWGGDWKSFVDRPHFQITFGFTEKELLQMYNDGKLENGYLKIK